MYAPIGAQSTGESARRLGTIGAGTQCLVAGKIDRQEAQICKRRLAKLLPDGMLDIMGP